jgi:hypothetical protein
MCDRLLYTTGPFEHNLLEFISIPSTSSTIQEMQFIRTFAKIVLILHDGLLGPPYMSSISLEGHATAARSKIATTMGPACTWNTSLDQIQHNSLEVASSMCPSSTGDTTPNRFFALEVATAVGSTSARDTALLNVD